MVADLRPRCPAGHDDTDCADDGGVPGATTTIAPSAIESRSPAWYAVDASISSDVTAVVSAICGLVTTVVGVLTFRRASEWDRLVNARLVEMLHQTSSYESSGTQGQDI